MRNRLLTITIALVFFGSSGCVAVAAAGAGAGTYAFVKGVTEVNVDAPYNDVWHAAGESLRELEVTITSQTRDALAGSYKGERHDGANVVVDLESVKRGTTKLRVRVGAFGDRAFQERLANNIQARL